MKTVEKRKRNYLILVGLIVIGIAVILEVVSYFMVQSSLKTLAQINTVHSLVNATLTKDLSGKSTIVKQQKSCSLSYSDYNGWLEGCSAQEAQLFPVNDQQQAEQTASQIYSALASALPIQEGQPVTNFNTAYAEATNSNTGDGSQNSSNFSIVLPESGGFTQNLKPDPSASPVISCNFEVSYALDKPISTLYGNFGLSENETNTKVVLTSDCTTFASRALAIYPFNKNGF